MDTCLADETRLNSIPDPSHIHIIKTIIFKVARVFIYMSPHDCLYYSYKKKKNDCLYWRSETIYFIVIFIYQEYRNCLDY